MPTIAALGIKTTGMVSTARIMFLKIPNSHPRVLKRMHVPSGKKEKNHRVSILTRVIVTIANIRCCPIPDWPFHTLHCDLLWISKVKGEALITEHLDLGTEHGNVGGYVTI